MNSTIRSVSSTAISIRWIAIGARLPFISPHCTRERRPTSARGCADDNKIDALLADLEPLIEGTLEGAVRISEIVKESAPAFLRPQVRREKRSVWRRLFKRRRNGRRAARDARSRSTTKFDDGLVRLGQEGQIHSVMGNLIDNALDAVRDVAEPRILIESPIWNGDRGGDG